MGAGNVDPRKELTFTVYDEDTFNQDDYLGTCTVPIASKDDDYTLNASDKVEHRKPGGMEQAASKKKRTLTKELRMLKITKLLAVSVLCSRQRVTHICFRITM